MWVGMCVYLTFKYRNRTCLVDSGSGSKGYRLTQSVTLRDESGVRKVVYWVVSRRLLHYSTVSN